ncbi:MAG: hypothetical protein WD266_13680 [Balneolales bacterium]
MIKTILVLPIALFCLVIVSPAQESPANWSIELTAGAGYSYFNVGSELSPAYGFNVRYSLSPVTAFYGHYSRGRFEGSGNNFFSRTYEMDFNHYSLRTQINFLQLLGLDRSFFGNSALNGIFGLGIMAYETEVDITREEQGWQDYQGQPGRGRTTVITAGGGVRQYLSRRLDLIAQFEYNFTGSDVIDGYETIPGSPVDEHRLSNDYYSFLTAGLSIKFGSSREQHTSWRQETTVTARDHQREMHDLLELFENRLAEVNEQVNQVNNTMDRLGERIDAVHQELNRQDDRLEELRIEVESVKESQNLGMLDYSEPALPQYFLIADTYTDESRAHEHLEELLQDGHQRARIIVDYDNSYYNVSYGQFGNFRSANEHLREIKRTLNPDAWIYTIR